MASVDNSKFAEWFLLWSSLTTVVPMSYSFSSLNPLVFVFKDMYNETYYKRYGEPMPESLWNALLPLTFSVPLLSALIGGLFTKYLLDKIGRKKSAILYHSICVVSSLIIALGGGIGKSYEAIIIGRLSLGIYIGLGLNLSVKHRQPVQQSIAGIALSLGALIGPCLGYNKVLGTAALWPYIAVVGMIPSALWLCTSYWMVESPYYLMRLGKRKQSIQVMTTLRNGTQEDIIGEVDQIEKEQSQVDLPKLENEQERKRVRKTRKVVGLKEMLNVKSYRLSFFAVLLMYSNIQCGGINNIVFYSDWILLEAGMNKDIVTPITIAIFFAQFVMACVGSRLLMRYGSRTLNLVGSATAVASLTLLTISQALKDTYPIIRYFAIAAMLFFMLGWAGGTNVATFAIVGELTSDLTRQTALMFGGSMFWIMAWLVGFISPYMMAAIAPYNFVPYIVLTAIIAVYMVFFVPDTRGKTSEEIQDYFKR